MRRNVHLWACCMCCLLGLSAGCGGTGSAAAVTLTGRAIYEVLSGVINTPPRDTPLTQTLLSFHTAPSNTEIARVQTDGAGNFNLSVPAGTYRVDLVDRAHQPSYDTVAPQDIVVNSALSPSIEVKFVLHAL